MHINIYMFCVYVQVKHDKWVFVLHSKIFISVFNCLGDDTALNVSSIYEIIFKITVAAGNQGLSKISGNMDSFSFKIYFNQIRCNLPSVYMIDNILQIPIAGSMKFNLTVVDKTEGNFRMRQRQSCDQVSDVTSLCHSSF